MIDAPQPHRSQPWHKRPSVWIVAVILVTIAVASVLETTGRPATIRYSDFLDQLDAGNLASVMLSGTQIDGQFKRPVAQAGSAKSAPLIVFRSRVPDIGDPTLFPELRANHVTIGVTSSQWLGLGGATILGVLAAFLLAKPMLLLIGAAFIAGLVRVARGGKMDIHSILSMVPMLKSFAGTGTLDSGRPLLPVLKAGDIVIMDNLGSHKAMALRQAIKAAGARLW